MGTIRKFVPEDVPAMVDLFERVMRGGDRSETAELRSYFDLVFFRNPWRDAPLYSLVYEDRGAVAGFLGVIPRRMSLEGRPVLVAISNNFMVDPAARQSLAGVQLMKTFLSGPQDLSLAEGNDLSRKLWEAVGGSLSLLYSIYWVSPLRLGSYALRSVEERGAARALRPIARVAARAIDAVAAWVPGSPFRRRQNALIARELTTEGLLAALSEVGARYPLRPEYTPESLGWLLGILAGKKGRGELRKVLLQDERGGLAGWYIYFRKAREISQVAQIGARPETAPEVLGHLFHDAWKGGAVGLAGRIEPRHTRAFAEQACLMGQKNSWVLVHSRDPEVMEPFFRGDAFASRLEAEWWITYA